MLALVLNPRPDLLIFPVVLWVTSLGLLIQDQDQRQLGLFRHSKLDQMIIALPTVIWFFLLQRRRHIHCIGFSQFCNTLYTHGTCMLQWNAYVCISELTSFHMLAAYENFCTPSGMQIQKGKAFPLSSCVVKWHTLSTHTSSLFPPVSQVDRNHHIASIPSLKTI